MLKRIMLFLLAACLPLAAPALAEGGERPQIILMACYQQVGWGVYADAAFLDEEGGIWHYENEMGLPREDAERLELEIAGGDLRSGIPALYGNAKHTKPTPTPFTKPKREAKALNEEAAEIIGEEEEE